MIYIHTIAIYRIGTSIVGRVQYINNNYKTLQNDHITHAQHRLGSPFHAVLSESTIVTDTMYGP